MKKLKYFFASAIVLVAVAISTIVFAEYKEQKGDIRFGNSINNNSITVTEGNLVKQGDIQINKTVSKIDDNGNYKVTFEVKGKDVETHTSNKKDVYAVVVLDKSNSMCENRKPNGDCKNPNSDKKWQSAITGAKTFSSKVNLNDVEINIISNRAHIESSENDNYVDINYYGIIRLTDDNGNIDGVLKFPHAGTTSSPKTIATEQKVQEMIDASIGTAIGGTY